MSQHTEKYDILMNSGAIDFAVIIRKDRDPIPTDDYSIGAEEGTKFVNKSTGTAFTCINNTIGLAQWVQDGTSTGGLPIGTRGDALVHNGTTWITLNIGASGEVLTSNGLDIEWGSASGLPTGAMGDILYHNGTSWIVRPAGNEADLLRFVAGVPVWVNLISDGVDDGDMLVWNATTSSYDRFPRGVEGQILQIVSSVPRWVTPGGLNRITITSTTVLADTDMYDAITLNDSLNIDLTLFPTPIDGRVIEIKNLSSDVATKRVLANVGHTIDGFSEYVLAYNENIRLMFNIDENMWELK